MGGKTARGDAVVRDLVGDLYDAILEPAGWRPAMRHLTEYLGARGAVLSGFEYPSAQCAFMVTEGASEELVRLFVERYITPERNLWARTAVRYPPGRAFTSEELVAPAEMERTEYYEAVLAPASFQRMLAANLTAEPSLVSQFSVYRSYRERPFERRDLDRFAPLIPHLQRASQLRLRLRALEQERSAALSVLDRLPLGVVLVDARAEVTFLNRRAREIIDSQDGLKVQGREIHAVDSGESAALRKLVGEAARTGMRRGTGSGGALLVSRPSAKRPLEILVAPLGEGSVRAEARGSAAVIFVSDPEREDEPAPQILQRLYRLTPAEAVVAVAVAQGRDPRHIAETLRVSVSTVRTHLYRAMAKTGTRRQTDLVRLLLRGPLGLRPG